MNWLTQEQGEYLTVLYPEHDILPHNLERSADCACNPSVTVDGPPTHFTVTHKLMMDEELVIETVSDEDPA